MSKKHLIRLDWPSGVLSPNARAHWGERAKAAKKARADACFLAQAANCRQLQADRLHVEILFYPPDARARDTDNMLASCKSALDGIADATGIDDSRWTYTLARGEPVKGGAVLVTVSVLEE